MGVFARFLTVWVGLAILAGIGIGQLLPAVPETLSRFEYASVSIPVAILIWAMIFPMMVQIDFASILNIRRQPKGLIITTAVNWLIKPFTMFAISWFFLIVVFAPLIPEDLGREYLAGAILLGAAPCTAMVFVWSYLTRGDAAYTLVQVSLNDIIMLFAFAPIVVLLLGISDIQVPWDTVALSVLLYIVIPLGAGYLTRVLLIRSKGLEWFDQVFMKRIGLVTPVALIVTLVLLFAFQGEVILNNPLHILLIAIPLFGLQHGAALATVVGVLVEVPLMLLLVRIANRTRGHFPAEVPPPPAARC